MKNAMLIFSQDTQERIPQESLLRQISLFWLLFLSYSLCIFCSLYFSLCYSLTSSIELTLFLPPLFFLSLSLSPLPDSLHLSLADSFSFSLSLSLFLFLSLSVSFSLSLCVCASPSFFQFNSFSDVRARYVRA